MRRFYSTGLGFTECAGSDDHWAAYVLGGVVLSLYPSEALGKEAGAGGESGGSRSDLFTMGCNVDTYDEVDEVFARWLSAGATVGAEPRDREWGGRSGYVLDPEGNAWEIAWAPGIVFGERGDVVAFGGD
jgi:uncharacterized glyoxalase superfamily protein PhnB